MLDLQDEHRPGNGKDVRAKRWQDLLLLQLQVPQELQARPRRERPQMGEARQFDQEGTPKQSREGMI
jgi:hypothetical protein